nr:SGNH/GDSL hydrolase family protein [Sphingomonas parva]
MTLVRILLSALALLSLAIGGPAAARQEEPKWVATWGSAQQEPEPHNALPPGTLDDATLRQLVRTTLAGDRIRIRVSNAFGKGPLAIRGVHVARAADPASPRIDPATDRTVTFAGASQLVVPAGADYVSDPVDLAVPALATLAVSIHVARQPAVQTGHPGSRATSWVGRGDQLAAAEISAPTRVDHWYLLSGIDVLAGTRESAIAILGDSITDGFGVKPNTNSRWTDFLAERLQASPRTRRLSVVNLGLGGNRLLNDGLGPNAAARFERDVLARSGVGTLIVFEGVNDLGTLTRDAAATPEQHGALVAEMIAAYAQIVAKARERGIRVIGATILPYGGSSYYHPDAANEADRQAINAWIRAPGHFDAVIDFDAEMRDPARPDRLRPDLDSGDGLHPSIEGYRAMAAAVPLALLR